MASYVSFTGNICTSDMRIFLFLYLQHSTSLLGTTTYLKLTFKEVKFTDNAVVIEPAVDTVCRSCVALSFMLS